MKKQLMGIAVAALLLMSCGKQKMGYMEARDNEMTIQSTRLEEGAGDQGAISYKIRVTPAKQVNEKISGKQKVQLIYNMDSCFYLNIAGVKSYAAMIQPVANGIKGTYEYLVEFAAEKKENPNSLQLTYQDKYINHKIYHLAAIVTKN